MEFSDKLLKNNIDKLIIEFNDYHSPELLDLNKKLFFGSSSLLQYVLSNDNNPIPLLNVILSIPSIDIYSKVNNAPFLYSLYLRHRKPTELTLFKNYTFEQKENFLNYQLESVVEGIHGPAISTVKSFIDYCIKYGANPNLRNEKKMRPVDRAGILYHKLTDNAYDYSSDLASTRREIYYHLLKKIYDTPFLLLKKMYKNFWHKGFPKEVINHIFEYHVKTAGDIYIAQLSDNLWPKTKRDYEEYKEKMAMNMPAFCLSARQITG